MLITQVLIDTLYICFWISKAREWLECIRWESQDEKIVMQTQDKTACYTIQDIQQTKLKKGALYNEAEISERCWKI